MSSLFIVFALEPVSWTPGSFMQKNEDFTAHCFFCHGELTKESLFFLK